MCERMKNRASSTVGECMQEGGQVGREVDRWGRMTGADVKAVERNR